MKIEGYCPECDDMECFEVDYYKSINGEELAEYECCKCKTKSEDFFKTEEEYYK